MHTVLYLSRAYGGHKYETFEINGVKSELHIHVLACPTLSPIYYFFSSFLTLIPYSLTLLQIYLTGNPTYGNNNN